MPTPSTVSNIADLVRRSALAHPDDVALVAGMQRITWAELASSVEALAAGLLRSGLHSGDRIALLLGNTPAFVATYFAVLRAGMVAVPVNTRYSAELIAGLLAEAAPRLVVAEAATADTARSAAGEHGPSVAVVGESSYDGLVRSGRRADTPAAPATDTFDSESLAVLLFTPGPTGDPRGAMLSHRALLANLDQLLELDNPPMSRTDVVLAVLPLFHVYALNTILGLATKVGARIVLLETFVPAGALEVIRAEGVTNVPGVPPMYVAWSREPAAAVALAGVTTLVSGSAPLAPAVLTRIEELSGRPVWEGYGMTEAGPVVSTTLVTGRPAPGTVGAPLPGVSVRILDDDGEEADDGDPGEIVLRGSNLFSGYWPDGHDGPDDDGWWRTGDVAYLDDDGDLHLVDRRRDVVVVSGFNVYPFEVERAICSHPDVAEAAVVGIPDAATGSAIKAYVVALEGRELSAESVQEHVRGRLARFKRPGVIEVVASLPHSASGKIQREVLRGSDG